jgi:hypothetical protein
VPNFLHHASANGGHSVSAGKPKSSLDLRVKSIEVGAQRLFVNRLHKAFLGALRRQRDAEGRSAAEMYPMIERRTMPT